MDNLRNPFAIRDGDIIFINDLDLNERGLNCRCFCPHCSGEFIARMGDVRVHHFAHSKEPCDEIVAYTTGLYKMIYQVLCNNNSFYLPALLVSYWLPYEKILDESNITSYLKIVPNKYSERDILEVFPEKCIQYSGVDLSYDKKGNIQAIELSVTDCQIAIKVMPPDTVCKSGNVSAHNNIATLVMDFSNDYNIIQTSTSESFQDYLMSVDIVKYWIYNPQIREVHSEIISRSTTVYNKHRERERIRKKEQEKQRLIEQQLEEQRKEKERITEERRMKSPEELKLLIEEETKQGYIYVKDMNFYQPDRIKDQYGRRWLKCEICGEIKRDSNYTIYRSAHGVNYGRCIACSNRKY